MQLYSMLTGISCKKKKKKRIDVEPMFAIVAQFSILIQLYQVYLYFILLKLQRFRRRRTKTIG